MEYREGKHSHFTHMGRQYYVDDLIALTKDKPIYFIDVSALVWVFEYSTPDEGRILKADLSVPIIVTEDRVNGKNELIILDGLHRLAQAVRKRKKTIAAYMVTKSDLKSLKER